MSEPHDSPQPPSPFSGKAATVDNSSDSRHGKSALWGGLILLLLLVLGGGLFWVVRTLNDPTRTLPEFPSEKYFANPDAIAGSAFQADLRVDADLGWRAETGRLMAFTMMNGGGTRDRLAVLIPSRLSDIIFDKNQAYRVELEVGEGGLIRAKSFKKL